MKSKSSTFIEQNIQQVKHPNSKVLDKIFQKKTLFTLGKVALISIIIILGSLIIFKVSSAAKTETLEIKTVVSVLQADGVVTPRDQAVLHFQTGGKLVYLPFKEGDRVFQGQVIARLDTSKLEANLRQAEQSFVAAKAISDKFYDGRDPNASESYDDKIKRTAIDAAQNIAYDSVVKARQDLTDATLLSPIGGVILQEDVDTINVNVTVATGFTVADPSSLVFRANILENDIDFVSVGNSVTIKLGEGTVPILGTVSKIYPDKVVSAAGQKVYQVDIETEKADSFNVVGQSGMALIQSNSKENVKLIPTWTVLNHDSVWVLADGKPVLRNVTVGKIHGDMTEILYGLKNQDEVITNPESIAAGKYRIL
jgi:RND family efflux transporter MFP subunit